MIEQLIESDAGSGSTGGSMVGQIYSELTILGLVADPDPERETRLRGKWWLCACNCGNYVKERLTPLRMRWRRDCGSCNFNVKEHHLGHLYEYSTWRNMLAKCYNPLYHYYPDFGGAKIGVCQEWKDSFDVFIKEVKYTTNRGYLLDLLDRRKPFCKENVQWANRFELERNRINNSLVEYNGEKRSLIEWSEVLDVKLKELRRWFKKGLTVEEILNKEKLNSII